MPALPVGIEMEDGLGFSGQITISGEIPVGRNASDRGPN